MKNLSIAVMLLVLSGAIQAQKFVVKTYFERAHTSSSTGVAMGLENYYRIEYGAFYQKVVKENIESQTSQTNMNEKQFLGFYAAIPVQYSNEVDFKFQVRSGMIDMENFVTTPSLLAHYKPVKQMRFSFGIGFRALLPTIQSSFSYVF